MAANFKKVKLYDNERELIKLTCKQKLNEIKEGGETGPIINDYIDKLEGIIKRMDFEPIKKMKARIIFENEWAKIKATDISLITVLHWSDKATQTLYFYHTKDFNANTKFKDNWNDYTTYFDRFIYEIKEANLVPYRQF